MATGANLRDLIDATPELSAMPATSARLLALLDDPDVPVSEVVAVVDADPGLTANILKLCNSAYYGLQREVGTVRDAVVRLGNREVLTLAFAASMGRVMQAPVTGYRLPRGQLWRHALAVALLAPRLLLDAADATQRSRAFTAGLVHDLGKLILDHPLRVASLELPAELDGPGLVQREQALLGFDHAEAGAALAEAWSFPADLAAVIGDHHASASDGPLLAAVGAANVLVVRHGHAGGATVATDDQCARAAQAVGRETDDALALAAGASRDLDGMLTILGAA